MKGQTRNCFLAAGIFLGAFALWTALLCLIDRQPIGPQGSTVGFAALNQSVRELIGVNMALYTLTDWLSLVPVGLVAGFGILGLAQWIGRKNLRKVDFSLLLLGG
ncbi:MAG: phosphoesterase PA-phosphatase, partial [Ruminococcaceae bacterium]|nr:phosphoesterase PA-phosphatase [Oscillospiraceae bacterium]